MLRMAVLVYLLDLGPVLQHSGVSSQILGLRVEFQGWILQVQASVKLT